MREVRLAFYKHWRKDWVNALIAGYTWAFNIGSPPYSHVEIGFKFEEGWRYFSSSMPDKGTRWKTAGQTVDKNPERWDVYEAEFEDEQVERMIERADSISGLKYDVLGILNFMTITGKFLNKEKYYYCSEACFFVLTGVKKIRLSPRRLSKKIIDSGFKKV